MAVRHGAPGWRLRPGRWNGGQRSLFFTRLAARPGLQQIDRQQHDEGGQQHDHGDGGGVVVLFQFGDDEQRRDFRHHRHIAGDEDDRAVFAGGAREGQREAGHQRWRDGRQDDAAESLPGVGAEAGGGLLQFALGVLQHRLDGAHDEGQADEGQRDDDAERRERHLDAEHAFEEAAEPAVGRIQRRQRDAGDGGRQRERQVDQRVDDALAGEFIAYQHPGDDAAEDDVEEGGDQRGAEGQLVRGHHALGRDGGPEGRPAHREGFEEHRRQRDQHDQRQVENGETERQPESRHHPEGRASDRNGGRDWRCCGHKTPSYYIFDYRLA